MRKKSGSFRTRFKAILRNSYMCLIYAATVFDISIATVMF